MFKDPSLASQDAFTYPFSVVVVGIPPMLSHRSSELRRAPSHVLVMRAASVVRMQGTAAAATHSGAAATAVHQRRLPVQTAAADARRARDVWAVTRAGDVPGTR